MYILHKSALPHTRINLNLQNLNLSTTFWPSNMKVDHQHNFNFSASLKFGKYKTTNKSFHNHFPFRLELWMYHTPLTWYEQENLGYKAHVEVLPRALWFLCLFTL